MLPPTTTITTKHTPLESQEEFESSQTTKLSDTMLNELQIVPSIDSEQNKDIHVDVEIKTKEKLDSLQQATNLENEHSSGLTKIEIFQIDFENIRPGTTIDGDYNAFLFVSYIRNDSYR